MECVWCHNAEGIPQYLEKESENKEISFPGLKKYTLDGLTAEIMKDRVFYDESGGGVSFSGGEPLMQPEFLIEILKKMKDLKIHTTVDTSGYAPEKLFSEVAILADLLLFDLKIVDNDLHIKYTGADNIQVVQNLEYLIKQKIPFRIRIPLINEITATDKNLHDIISLLKNNSWIPVDLLPYHALGQEKSNQLMKFNKTTNLSAPADERIKEIRQMFETNGFDVRIGG
jgi:pyruvate formate lyase activating enzyme